MNAWGEENYEVTIAAAFVGLALCFADAFLFRRMVGRLLGCLSGRGGGGPPTPPKKASPVQIRSDESPEEVEARAVAAAAKAALTANFKAADWTKWIDEAEALHRTALEARETRKGASHPLTVEALEKLSATIMARLRDWDENGKFMVRHERPKKEQKEALRSEAEAYAVRAYAARAHLSDARGLQRKAQGGGGGGGGGSGGGGGGEEDTSSSSSSSSSSSVAGLMSTLPLLPSASTTTMADQGREYGTDCVICGDELDGKVWACPICCTVSHLCCLAGTSLAHAGAPRTQLMPRDGWCETCGLQTPWGNIVLGLMTAVPALRPVPASCLLLG